MTTVSALTAGGPGKLAGRLLAVLSSAKGYEKKLLISVLPFCPSQLGLSAKWPGAKADTVAIGGGRRGQETGLESDIVSALNDEIELAETLTPTLSPLAGRGEKPRLNSAPNGAASIGNRFDPFAPSDGVSG